MKYGDIDLLSKQKTAFDMRDYPDFCDAYCCYAEFIDGTPLNDEQLDQLNDNFYEAIYEQIINEQMYI